MVKIYLLGVLVTLLLILLTEHLYLGAGHASSISRRDIFEDAALSLLSWVGVVLVVIFFIGEYLTKFNNYGYSKELADYEEALCEEADQCEEEPTLTIIDNILLMCDRSVTGSVSIPEGVTEIDERAFLGCKDLTSIEIPDSVTRIGNYAFEGCSGLKEIVLPDSLWEIGDSAFEGCSSLREIVFPDSVREIGFLAFGDCSSLQEVVVPKSVKEIDSNTFNFCSSIKKIRVNVRNRFYDSRDDCNAIIETKSNALVLGCANTVIPETVTEIRGFAFQGSSDLQEIDIPDSVTKIGGTAFAVCSSLRSIHIPKSVRKIGINPLDSCDNLRKITVDAENKYYDSRDDCNAIIETRSNTLIAGCANTVIPDSVTKIDHSAFYGCSGLKEIVIPDSVREIGAGAFEECNDLRCIRIKDAKLLTKSEIDRSRVRIIEGNR